MAQPVRQCHCSICSRHVRLFLQRACCVWVGACIRVLSAACASACACVDASGWHPCFQRRVCVCVPTQRVPHSCRLCARHTQAPRPGRSPRPGRHTSPAAVAAATPILAGPEAPSVSQSWQYTAIKSAASSQAFSPLCSPQRPPTPTGVGQLIMCCAYTRLCRLFALLPLTSLLLCSLLLLLCACSINTVRQCTVREYSLGSVAVVVAAHHACCVVVHLTSPGLAVA